MIRLDSMTFHGVSASCSECVATSEPYYPQLWWLQGGWEGCNKATPTLVPQAATLQTRMIHPPNELGKRISVGNMIRLDSMTFHGVSASCSECVAASEPHYPLPKAPGCGDAVTRAEGAAP